MASPLYVSYIFMTVTKYPNKHKCKKGGAILSYSFGGK